jgi:protease IV
VKAIVLRVDSLGGDAMASDYIAEVVRKYKDKKPIIVSQGAVAASGGYWLSMDAGTIVSSPVTITGSIGVISSWIYDKGLKDDLGIGTSIVKHGKYSDLGMSYQLPIIPIGLPLRNLNQDERNQFEGTIRSLYTDFVTKVASGRKMSYNAVDSIAQGRVWTGKSAKEIGLVDKLGGLSYAIKLAKEQANLKADEDINIYEFPKQELFDLSLLFSNLFGFDSGVNLKESDLNDIIYRLKNNGTAMPVLPIEYLELTK